HDKAEAHISLRPTQRVERTPHDRGTERSGHNSGHDRNKSDICSEQAHSEGTEPGTRRGRRHFRNWVLAIWCLHCDHGSPPFVTLKCNIRFDALRRQSETIALEPEMQLASARG